VISTKGRGRIILESVPSGEVRSRAFAYLSNRFKHVPHGRLKLLLQRGPIVLVEGVPAKRAAAIVAHLEKRGAKASFFGPERSIEEQTDILAETTRGDTPSGEPDLLAPPPISFTESSGRHKRLSLFVGGVALLLIVAGVAYYLYHAGVPGQGPLPAHEKGVSPGTSSLQDSSRMRSLALKLPSVMTVAPENMRAAFLYQYRMRPDHRFLRAFDVLARRYSQIRGSGPSVPPAFQVGVVAAGAKEARIPLLRRRQIPFVKSYETVGTITVPIPSSFPQIRRSLDEFLAAMVRVSGPVAAPRFSQTDSKRFETALSYIDMFDPRSVAIGLCLLDEVWQDGYRDGKVLRAAAKGYAILMMVLSPDVTQAADSLAAEALAFLTLARGVDPNLPVYREEALLAQNMGYGAYADSLVRDSGRGAVTPEESLLESYLRGDIQALKNLVDTGNPTLLGHYLLARLFRENRLWKEAQNAASALMERFPTAYLSVIENIYSGDLEVAKGLTVLYPRDILDCLGTKVSPESLKTAPSWIERLKGTSSDKPTETTSLSKFAVLLDQWSPREKDGAQGLIIDGDRVKTVYRVLYRDAVYLRFNLLSGRWGVMDRAKAYVDSFAAADKDHPLVLFMEGQVLRSLGDRKLAYNRFNRVISHPEAGGFLACRAFNSLDVRLEKIHSLSLVAEQLDGRPDHRFSMGRLFQEDVYDPDLALTFYTAGVADDPYRYWIYKELARVRGSGEPLLKALQRFPSAFALLEGGGDYLSKEGDRASLEKALALLEKAQGLAPADSLIAGKRAVLLAELRRQTEAIRILSDWIDRSGKGDTLALSSAKAARADIYLEMGRPRRAWDSLGQDVDPNQADVMIVMARTYEGLKKVGLAAETYRKAVEKYPRVSGVLARAAGFLWRQGDDSGAAKVIAGGRQVEGPFSRWYSEEFLKALGKAPDDRIAGAARAIKGHGGGSWEMGALGLSLARNGRPETAFRMLSQLKGKSTTEDIENVVSAYEALKRWKGKETASRYLRENIAGDYRHLVITEFRKNGLSGEILEEIGDPDSYAPQYREFMWLQMLIAWLEQDERPADLAKRLRQHYQDERKNPHHVLGRYFLGIASREATLRQVQSLRERCEFSYYVGLAERLRGNYPEATFWYHICLETQQQNIEEFVWATHELFWWTRMGTDNRHRLLRDDYAAYALNRREIVQLHRQE
jgi:hypothetical protein